MSFLMERRSRPPADPYRYRKWAEIEMLLLAMRRLMANGVDRDAMMMRGRV